MRAKQNAKPKQRVIQRPVQANLSTHTGGITVEGGSETVTPLGEDSADTAAPIFVWLLFGCLLAYHLAFVVQHSFPVPYWDESSYIPYVVGAQPVTPGWLWSQANEHRIPLPRLLYLGLARISHYDARLMNGVTVLLLASTAGLLIWRLRRLEGRTTFFHAFLPLLLLNPAHYWNTVWPNQTAFVLPTCFLCCAVAILAQRGEGLARYFSIGPLALVTCMCGANGLPLALAIAPLPLWMGVQYLREGARRRGFISLLCGSAIYLYTGVYFIHLNRDVPRMRPWLLGEAIIESFKAISMSIGPAAEFLWPYAAILITALLIACTFLLLSVILKQPGDRMSAVGLLLALAGSVGLAIGIGFGRTVLGRGAGFASRYATIVAPILFTIFVAFTRFGTIAVRRFVQVTLLMTMCSVFPMNGIRGASEINAQLADGEVLEREVSQHVSIAQLAAEHGSKWMFRPDIFADHMRLLLDAGTGIYRRHPPVNGDGDVLWVLSEGTELRGPSTSGQLVQLDKFQLPKSLGLIAHAPHRASVTLAAASPGRLAKFVHVGFGILPGKTSGVDFRVSLRMPDGRSNLLWSRTLDPVAVPSDAGIKEADITLPQSLKRKSRIVFETAVRTGQSNVGDWSFWTAVRVR
jgi:hypothetical protein